MMLLCDNRHILGVGMSRYATPDTATLERRRRFDDADCCFHIFAASDVALRIDDVFRH